jgi:hypothetical protein
MDRSRVTILRNTESMIKEESVAENSEEWTPRDEERITREDQNRLSNIHIKKETLAVEKSWEAGSGPG